MTPTPNDPYQFEWHLVKYPPNYWQGTFRRLPLLIPLLVGGVMLAKKLAESQQFMVKSEVFFILNTALISFLFVVNTLMQIFVQGWGPKIIHCEVSQKGLLYNNHLIPLTTLRNSTVEETLKKSTLPPDQWTDTPPLDGKPLSLLLNHSTGKLNLLFSYEKTRQQLIHSLSGYFNEMDHPNQP